MSPQKVAALLLASLAILFLGGLLSRRVRSGNRSHPRIRGVSFLCAALLVVSSTLSPWALETPTTVWSLGSWQLVHWDSLASIMLMLVSFIGWVVSSYSMGYLDGEKDHGRFMGNVACTVAFLGLSVIAGNLLMLLAAWFGASMSLHGLLVHDRHRVGAQQGARHKWIVSRMGDLPLLVALVWIYLRFGTWNFAELFQGITTVNGPSLASLDVKAIGILVALGAAIKSAQWPFHFWLPETLEAPTPVSALMHAGIVNAGGFLMIRMSPLLIETPSAHLLLIVAGTITAFLAGIVLMTQTSVKRCLVYSTIGQMGIMMLQCGLGAYAAALVHIVAHSLYKSYAFLTSGEVLSQSRRTAPVESSSHPRAPTISLVVASISTVATCWIASRTCGLSLETKPGGWLLAAILCLGLTKRFWYQLRLGGWVEFGPGFLNTVGLCFSYALGFRMISTWTASTIPSASSNPVTWPLLLFVFMPFFVLFAIETLVSQRVRFRMYEHLYAHAANGFYADLLPRWIQRAWSH